MNIVEKNWNQILNKMKQEYCSSNIAYNTWVAPLTVYEVKDNTVYILVKLKASLEHIEEKYLLPFKVCLLFGISGQTAESMQKDIETGLKYFERICINIMVENTTPIRPDQEVIRLFVEQIYPKYKENQRVDILLQNTDFGVGGEEKEKEENE